MVGKQVFDHGAYDVHPEHALAIEVSCEAYDRAHLVVAATWRHCTVPSLLVWGREEQMLEDRLTNVEESMEKRF
jgi:hypothetical protein